MSSWGVLAGLTAAGLQYLLATALAVEAAVLHNFGWHQHFTWSDREGAILGRLGRFHVSNGTISILGNLLLMRLLVGYFGLPAVPANLGSIAVCSLLNFLAADRLVFLGNRTPSQLALPTADYAKSTAAKAAPSLGAGFGMPEGMP